MSRDTTVLITGANRGIGKGLLEVYLSRPNTTAIAGVRNPTDANSQALNTLPKGSGSRLLVVKIESTSETDAAEAVQLLQSTHGISKLDIVIANAGISKYYGLAGVTPIQEMRDHLDTNTIGPLILFQAVLPLLEAAPEPKLVFVSTGAASIEEMGSLPLQITAYGSSKAALNYMARKISFEYPRIITISISPGWVQTDMGNEGAASNGMAEAPTTVKESVDGVVATIDSLTKAQSGSFASFDGMKYKW